MVDPVNPDAGADAPAPDHADDQPLDFGGSVIAGRIIDRREDPLVGVRVEAAVSGDEASLDALPVMSDGDGCFRLDGLVDGAYDVRFQLGNVKARVVDVPVGKTDLVVRMARPQGLVLDARCAPGQTLPPQLHLLVERRTKWGWRREHVGRSIRRRVRLWNLRPGTYRVAVWGPPYLPVAAEDVEVVAGEPAPDVPIFLSAEGCVLRGELRCQRGGDADVPTAGWISWRPLGDQIALPPTECTRVVDALGAFHVHGLEPGPYLVSAWSDWGTCSTTVELSEQGPSEQGRVLTLRTVPSRAR